MAITLQSARSTCVVWRTQLPRVLEKYGSPIFSIYGSEFRFTLQSDWERHKSCENWGLHLNKVKPNMKDAFNDLAIIGYIENDKGEFESFEFCNYLCTEEMDSHFFSEFYRRDIARKCTSRDICMLFVFHVDCHKETVISEGPGCAEREKHEKGKQSELSGDMEKLFDTRQHTDVVLKCSDLSFPAHRCILSTRSEVFSAMFRSQMTESTSGQMDIEDLEPTILEPFLRCIYSDNVEALTMDTVMGVYSAAEKYAVHSLKRKCASFMKDNLSEDLVSPVLLLADKFGDSELLEAVLSFVAGKAEFLKTTEWKKFAEQYPLLGVKVYKKFHE